jgi:hypothetical protein
MASHTLVSLRVSLVVSLRLDQAAHLLLENQTAKRTKHVVLPVMLVRVAVKLHVARKSEGKRGSPLICFVS